MASAGDPRSDAVFRMRGVSKVYRMGEVEVRALDNVDLDLYGAEFVVLLGASGSGKSTLVNILGGLDIPSAGTVWYRDHDLTGAADDALTAYRREHVGFVFQFYNLIPSLTASENVALVTEIASDPMDPREALGLVGLADRVDHFPSQMPSGPRRRSWHGEALHARQEAPARPLADARAARCGRARGDVRDGDLHHDGRRLRRARRGARQLLPRLSLRASPGDQIEIEILEGDRRKRMVMLQRVVDEPIGMSGYMDIGALANLMGEGPTYSDAYLRVDPHLLVKL